jgi:hypothetical protein
MSFIRTLRIVGRHVTGQARFPPEGIATCTRPAIAEILQRPNPARRHRTYRASPNEPVTPNSREKPSPTTITITDDYPKSDSAAAQVNGIAIKTRRFKTAPTGAIGLVFREKLTLDLTEAQREPKLQPPRVVDDLDRVAVAVYNGVAVHTQPILPAHPRSPT